MKARTDTRETLARNLAYLMKDRGWSQPELARRSGVSQKTVSNMLNAVGSPYLENVEAIAEAFGLNLWHLIMPTLIEDLQHGGSIHELYAAYFGSSNDGKAHILRVAQREAEYLIAGSRTKKT